MEDYLPDPSLYESEKKFKGINWNGLILAPTLQCLILMLPHLSNYVKERHLRAHHAATESRKEELLQLKKELQTISMTDEFARHAKLQRKINAIQEVLTAETTEATNKATAVKNKFHSACYGSLIFSHLIMIMYHRSTPLFVLPAQWFGPINWIISFPTGINGAVGFTFWLVTCRRIINSTYHWLFPASQKVDGADENMLSNLMNSMMGGRPGATPGFPGATPGLPGVFPGAFPPSGAFPGAMPARGQSIPALTSYPEFDSRESSPESMEKMMVPALD